MNEYMMVNDMKEYMSVIEMAKYLHIGRSRAYELVRDKDFPSVKVGRKYIVSVYELKEWLKQKTAETK